MKRHTFVHRGTLEHNRNLPPNATHFITAKGRRRGIRSPNLDGIIFGFQDTPEGIALTQVDEIRLSTRVPIRRAHYAGLKALGPNGGDIGDRSARLMLEDAARANPTLRALLRKKGSRSARNRTAVSPPSGASEEATDVAKPPRRYVAQVTRVVRDTAMVRRLKQLHGDRCQLCGTRIRLVDGSSYSEGHHLQPLGGPHRGPDIAANILVLCPNCHAICDMAGRLLKTSQIRDLKRHACGSDFIRYHNALARRQHGVSNRGDK
jgi:5-methylcytosine-specific restriction endonuclease McrA